MLARLLLLASAAIAALALTAGTAAAKGVEAATVCGADKCVDVGGDDITPALLEGGSPSDPPSNAHGWYRVRLEIGDGRPGGRVYETWTINVLPQSGYIRSRDGYGGSTWSDMSADQQAIYTSLTAGLEPLPAADLEGIPKRRPPATPNPAPASPSPGPATDDDGGSAWPWLIALVAGALAASYAIRLARRRPARSDSARPA